MELEAQIISASYTFEDNYPVIELYTRCKDGSSAVILYPNFKPYCYFKDNEVSTRQILRTFGKNITKHEFVDLEHMLLKEKYVKIYTDKPETVATIRRKFEEDTPFMSADILFPLRFIYDLDLGYYIKAAGRRIENNKYNADIVLVAQNIENCDPFKSPPSILSLDIETSLEHNTILTICVQSKRGDGSVKDYKIIGEEKDIIKQFINILIEEDPDIITGYNIMFYDLPKISERAKSYRLPLRIGRNDRALWFKSLNGKEYPQLTGRIIADAWLHTKNLKKPKRETLNYVSKKFLGEEKMDVNSKEIDREWEEDRIKVIEYCLKDAELALRLLEYIKIIDKNISLAGVAQLPLSFIFENRTSTLADSLLIRFADRQGFAVPCARRHTGGKKIEGGYVRETEPGLYKWVLVLDFKSMYPSIIIKNNLCLTTYAPNLGEIKTPIGAQFLSPGIREGMVPKIMQKLLNDRGVVKKQLKEAKKNNAAENEIAYLDDLQYSIKVLANSFYGLFTSSFYRFTNPKIGASITAYARKWIKHVIEELEKDDIEVIASDTDSVFFLSPYEDKEQTVKFGEEISKRFSDEVFELEFEKVYQAFFTHGKKKRYFGKIVWPSEEEDVKGYETKRRDSFDALTDTMEAMFTLVLNDKTTDAVLMAREVVRDCQHGKIPIEKLIISKSVRPEHEYANPERMAQVQCARKMKEMNQIVAPYMSVSWIVTNSRVTPQQVDPYIPGIPFEKTPDWNYYANRLARGLSRITDVFEWTEDRLLTGTHQASLINFGEC